MPANHGSLLFLYAVHRRHHRPAPLWATFCRTRSENYSRPASSSEFPPLCARLIPPAAAAPLLLDLDLESGALDQLAGALEIPSGGGQVAVDEDRIDGVENLALPVAEIQFPSARRANFTARVEQPKEARGFE